MGTEVLEVDMLNSSKLPMPRIGSEESRPAFSGLPAVNSATLNSASDMVSSAIASSLKRAKEYIPKKA